MNYYMFCLGAFSTHLFSFSAEPSTVYSWNMISHFCVTIDCLNSWLVWYIRLLVGTKCLFLVRFSGFYICVLFYGYHVNFQYELECITILI